MGRIATNNYCKNKAGLSQLPSGITNGNQCPTKAVILSAYGSYLQILNNSNYSDIQLVQEQDVAIKDNWVIQVGLYNSQRCKDRKFIKNIYFVIADNFSNTDLASRKSQLQIYLYIPDPPNQQAPNSTNSYPNTNVVAVQNGSNYNGFTVYYKIYDGYNISMNGTLGTPISCSLYNVRVSGSYDFRNKFLVGMGYRGWFGSIPGALSVEEFNLYISDPSTIDVYAPPALITLKNSYNIDYQNINYSDGSESYNPLKFTNKINPQIQVIQNLKSILTSKTTLVNNGKYYIKEDDDGISIQTESTLDFIHGTSSQYLDKTITGYSIVDGELRLSANAWKSQRCNNMYYTKISWHGVNIRYDDIEPGMRILNSINYNEMLVAGNGGLYNSNNIVEEKFLRNMPNYISDVHIRITYGDVKYVNNEAILSDDRYTIETCVNIAETNDTYSIGGGTVGNNVTVKPYDQDQRQFLVGYTEDGRYSYIAHTSYYITIYKIEVQYNYKSDEIDTTTHTYTHTSEASDSNPAHKIVRVNLGSQNAPTKIEYFDETNSGGEGYLMPENLPNQFQRGFIIGLPQFECEHNIINRTGRHIKFRLLNDQTENVKFYQFGNQIKGNININIDGNTTPSYCHMDINGTNTSNENGVPIVETLCDIEDDYRICLRCSTLSIEYTINGLESIKQLTYGGNTIGYVLILQQRSNNNKVHTTSGSYGGTEFWHYLKSLKGRNRIIYVDCKRISN